MLFREIVMTTMRNLALATAVILPTFAASAVLNAADRARARSGDRTATKQVERKRDRVHRTQAQAQKPKAAAGLRVQQRDRTCTPKAAPAALRIRRQDRDRLCDECGYFVPGGEYVCDWCGTLCIERDADGDGVPNCEDEDYQRPRDGTGNGPRAE
jgi:rubrerythrin